MKRLKLLLLKIIYSKEERAKKSGVKIGKNCSIATEYFGSEPYMIEIGDDVQITQDVRFYTHGGGWIYRKKDPTFDFFGKIVVGSNVYIGNSAHILPGVKIGDNVIIGAASVVTKSVPSNSIVAGNPAKIVGNVDEYFEKIKQYNLKTKGLSYDEKMRVLLSADSSKLLNK